MSTCPHDIIIKAIFLLSPTFDLCMRGWIQMRQAKAWNMLGHGRPCWFIPTLFSSSTRLSHLIYFCCLHSSFCLLTFLKLLLFFLFLRSVWEWQQHRHVWSRNHGVPMWISLVSFIPSQFVLPFSHWAQLWANDFSFFPFKDEKNRHRQEEDHWDGWPHWQKWKRKTKILCWHTYPDFLLWLKQLCNR